MLKKGDVLFLATQLHPWTEHWPSRTQIIWEISNNPNNNTAYLQTFYRNYTHVEWVTNSFLLTSEQYETEKYKVTNKNRLNIIYKDFLRYYENLSADIEEKRYFFRKLLDSISYTEIPNT